MRALVRNDHTRPHLHHTACLSPLARAAPPTCSTRRLCRARSYRKPRNSYKNHKSEVRSRHAAFARGATYLERYCLLIGFAAFLDATGADASFARWLASRPDLQQALGAIHANPAAALAAVPAVRSAPVVYSLPTAGGSASGAVTPDEQVQVCTGRGREGEQGQGPARPCPFCLLRPAQAATLCTDCTD